MQDLLDEINKLPKPKPKVHTVCIQGEDAYEWKTPTEFVLKPPPKVLKTYKTMKKAKKGLCFFDNDPYYPDQIVLEGFTWTR